MSSPATPSPTKISTPTAPMKVVKEKKEKVVKEKAGLKEKVGLKEKAGLKEKDVTEEDVANAGIEREKRLAADAKAPVEKKPRAPTLPAKYSKFIQYSYFLIRALNNKSLETDGEVLVDEDKFFDMAHVFADMGDQQELVSSFLENKTIAKEMRAHIADKKKAAVKATKEAAKAAVKATKDAAKEATKATKVAAKEATKAAKGTKATKGKAKASKKTEVPDLVTSLVTLANATTDANTMVDVAAEEEEELDVQIFTHDSKTYLIDDNNTLYDNETHLVIGTWDKENLTILHA